MLRIIITLVIGGIAGWIAGKLMDSEGSVIRNIILGLVGGGVGNFVLGLIGGTLVSVLGACILIWLFKKIR